MQTHMPASEPHIQPWKVLSSRIVYETPWMQVIEDQCDHNGKSITYTYVARRDEGPVIIPEAHDGKLWMVQQYRHPIKKIVWQFPAEGKIPEETWAAAARRGLHEELSLDSEHLEDLGEIYVDPGMSAQKTHVFLARQLNTISQIEKHHLIEDEVEDLQTAAFSLAEIENLIQNGEICDNWTLAALYLYQRAQLF